MTADLSSSLAAQAPPGRAQSQGPRWSTPPDERPRPLALGLVALGCAAREDDPTPPDPSSRSGAGSGQRPAAGGIRPEAETCDN